MFTARAVSQALDEAALLKACSSVEGAGGAGAMQAKVEAIRARRAWVMEAMALKRVARMRSSAGARPPHALMHADLDLDSYLQHA